ncbi:MAG: hypothetical protein WCI66_08635 [Gammaproteobacteria bacterium]
MNNKAMITRFFALCMLMLASSSPLQAQEGHPLAGTWQGEWGNGNLLTLTLEWNGKAIVGTTNPGPTATNISTVVLDSSTWTVSVTTDLKDDAGKTTHFSFSGKLDNIGSPTRSVQARWKNDSESGTFTLARQNGA